MGTLNPYRKLVAEISPTEFEKLCLEILKGYAEAENLSDFSIQHIQIDSIGDAKILERAEQFPVNGFGQTNFCRNAVVEVWKNALAVHTLRGSRQAQQNAWLIIG